jgi:isoleucyl-tRNA synthetase
MSFPEQEEVIIKYWAEVDAFKEQLRKTRHLPPYTFYDGPPFATGTPHYGHIAAGTIKDVVCRYASQTGHYVERRFGWDCHGLPVEFEIDKELKIGSKGDVVALGIANYNKACRGIVMRYSGEWEKVVGRFGRWVDFRNDYKTMDTNFMESVWYVFKVLFEQGLVYSSRRIMPYSNACSTVLSNFEVQQNYKEVEDPSLFITFPLATQPDVKLLAWTTTPWTLPSNLALAVHPELDYVKVRDVKRNEVLIMGQSRLAHFFGKEQYEVLERMKGSELEGL